jgi:hypothetical protein
VAQIVKAHIRQSCLVQRVVPGRVGHIPSFQLVGQIRQAAVSSAPGVLPGQLVHYALRDLDEAGYILATANGQALATDLA